MRTGRGTRSHPDHGRDIRHDNASDNQMDRRRYALLPALDYKALRAYLYITQQAGAGVLMICTDYGHQDMSVELDALRTLGEQGTWTRWSPRRAWTTTRGRCTGSRNPSRSVVHAKDNRKKIRHGHGGKTYGRC